MNTIRLFYVNNLNRKFNLFYLQKYIDLLVFLLKSFISISRTYAKIKISPNINSSLFYLYIPAYFYLLTKIIKNSYKYSSYLRAF